MACKTIIYPVRDLETAKAIFTALLGMEPTTDSPYYVGFEDGDQQIGLDPNGHEHGNPGPVPFWHITDIAGRIDALVAAGATVRQPATEVGGGRTMAILEDADGNPVGLIEDTV